MILIIILVVEIKLQAIISRMAIEIHEKHAVFPLEQSVALGDHNISLGVHEDAAGSYRVGEWDGVYIMVVDDEGAFTAEYVYGNHFERMMDEKVKEDVDDEEED
ncbi:hypothetical protein IEQ34_016404 [Dendrobium chrysotoxum]|uniref:Uncharacterized protein n=1 Tax=Dendrobium chrysotoxum TaxID=161865 RepID=A0AAV7GE12_DENCH|nr:hypothetical protein IEQ34_016404 [Dendrobium chrysotoxum]